jgi:hypothetical protein
MADLKQFKLMVAVGTLIEHRESIEYGDEGQLVALYLRGEDSARSEVD